MGSVRTILSFLLLFGTVLAFSQRGAVSIKSDSAIVASNAEMRSLMVQIENTTEIPQDLVLVTQADKGVRILNPQASIKIEPKERVFVSFKIFIEKIYK